MKTIVVLPAYGRIYNNPEDAAKDWTDGKDFRAPNGYCSIRDKTMLKDDGFTHVGLLYRQDGTACIKEIEL